MIICIYFYYIYICVYIRYIILYIHIDMSDYQSMPHAMHWVTADN